ncbi:MAG: ABC transporter ATP-binding protein [Ardenticatenaceae bacterium]|nr:ABC transporter ATP-binding protein [Ardenticatenaceae bacterium]
MLSVHHFTKTFGDTIAVNDVSFSVKEGDILCLLGPSGCGKTTLLRLIAGLETADSGRLTIDGQPPAVQPHERDFGMMFQNFALFPHKNVFDNVAFGLLIRGMSDIDRRVAEMLELVALTGYEKRTIDQLSGGEQQRVALARSLATQPRLLLLDEPLGSLDRALREKLMIDLRLILKQVGVTAISVTHDQSEAFAIADQIAVMNHGQIEQLSPPEILFSEPRTPFVARFLGFSNIVPGRWLENGRLDTPLGAFDLSYQPGNGPVDVLIRPTALSSDNPDHGIPIHGTITAVTFRGRFYQVAFTTNHHNFIFELPAPKPSLGPFRGFLDSTQIWPLPNR